jgi:hypothetical protein
MHLLRCFVVSFLLACIHLRSSYSVVCDAIGFRYKTYILCCVACTSELIALVFMMSVRLRYAYPACSSFYNRYGHYSLTDGTPQLCFNRQFTFSALCVNSVLFLCVSTEMFRISPVDLQAYCVLYFLGYFFWLTVSCHSLEAVMAPDADQLALPAE